MGHGGFSYVANIYIFRLWYTTLSLSLSKLASSWTMKYRLYCFSLFLKLGLIMEDKYLLYPLSLSLSHTHTHTHTSGLIIDDKIYIIFSHSRLTNIQHTHMSSIMCARTLFRFNLFKMHSCVPPLMYLQTMWRIALSCQHTPWSSFFLPCYVGQQVWITFYCFRNPPRAM